MKVRSKFGKLNDKDEMVIDPDTIQLEDEEAS